MVSLSLDHTIANAVAASVYGIVAIVAAFRLLVVHKLWPVNKKRVFHVLLIVFAVTRATETALES